MISLLLYVLISIAPIEGAESSGSLSKFLDSIKTIPIFSKHEEEYEDSEPELIVIDNLYITNRLYGTEVIVDPYGDVERPKRNYYEDYEDEDEEW